ncbi:glycoside hydrolase family 1 protein [Medicago truncatula]|uniref:Glycoside hydrolase family 1 protein n=1 Tax=Medicago truncatula TaxID=3880 RepID=G7KE10_MEDTR|nr:glycoside hydrolase family 1 protein [Medicago truncatula]
MEHDLFLVDRRNDKIIINSHTSGGTGVRTSVMVYDTIDSICDPWLDKSRYAANEPNLNTTIPCYLTDSLANLTTERNGISIGPQIGFILLIYIKEKYNSPLIYVTENGKLQQSSINIVHHTHISYTSINDPALNDIDRINYYHDHLSIGVNVKGYFVWSLLDNIEWDYNNNLKRYQKLSAQWFKNFLKRL